MKWKLWTAALGIALLSGAALKGKWYLSPSVSLPRESKVKAVTVPIKGSYRWQPDGLLEITMPKKQRVLWNPSSGVLSTAKPLPHPTGIPKERSGNNDEETLTWHASPDGQWTLVTQTFSKQWHDRIGLWPISQRDWLLDRSGKPVTPLQVPYRPWERGPLWFNDSSLWVSITPEKLFIHDRRSQLTTVPLPDLPGKNWNRFLCSFLRSGKILLTEVCQEIPQGVTFTPLEHIQFRTVDSMPPHRVDESVDFPLRVSSTSSLVIAQDASVSPDGEYVVVLYFVATVLPGQALWGRYLALAEPRNPHFETWISRRDGSDSRCIASGPESYFDYYWHPDSKRLLLVGASYQAVVTAVSY